MLLFQTGISTIYESLFMHNICNYSVGFPEFSANQKNKPNRMCSLSPCDYFDFPAMEKPTLRFKTLHAVIYNQNCYIKNQLYLTLCVQ